MYIYDPGWPPQHVFQIRCAAGTLSLKKGKNLLEIYFIRTPYVSPGRCDEDEDDREKRTAFEKQVYCKGGDGYGEKKSGPGKIGKS